MQGKLVDSVKLYENEKEIGKEVGEIQLTNYGVSGICVFNLSGRVSKGLEASEKEKIEIKYITECSNKENYLKLLKERRKLDIIKGFTTKGVHRDDFVIYINNKNGLNCKI